MKKNVTNVIPRSKATWGSKILINSFKELILLFGLPRYARNDDSTSNIISARLSFIYRICVNLVLLVLIPNIIWSKDPEESTAVKKVLEQKLNQPLDQKVSQQPSKDQKQEKELYSFNYKDTPLVDVINEFAAKKKINIILPQPQSPNALTTKITYQLPNKVTLKQAWREVNKILSFIGYSWVPYDDLLILNKISNDLKREPLTVYKNPAIEDLPNDGTVVQAIFYLANLKLSNDSTRANIEAILKSMLSPTADIKRDEKTNALIITDKSDNIRAAMIIIKELDLEGIPDAIEVIPLYYTEAAFVEDLFKNKLLLATPSPIPTRETSKQVSYFPPNTKVLALGRTNAIVIMGSLKALRVVKDFIEKYIDRPLESGESILHLYDLQYLNAEDFQPILQDLVNKSVTGQAQTQGQTIGPQRDFQDVIIVAEKSTLKIASPKKSEATQIAPSEAPTSVSASVSISGETQGIEQAGNRLIVAARKQDWLRIKALIDDLDKPQPQVAIEVLVVDLTLNNDKILGSQMRNKGSLHDSISPNVDFQTAMIDSPVLKMSTGDINTANGTTIPVYPNNALMANLLAIQNGNNGNFSLATEGGIGSMVISFNDPDNSGIWNVWQILDAYTNSTLIAQPFITTADNRQASITIAEQRLVDGDAVSQVGGIKVQKDDVVAATSIDILPRISVDNNNINLNIIVKVEQFEPENNNRATRLVQTNANVGNGEVLALGGLISLNDTISNNETPLLAKIPILGWFFKRKEKNKTKNNLMIFISPRIMYPRVKGGVGAYTKDKLCYAKNELTEELAFETLRDPVTRWFFKPNYSYADTVVSNLVNHEMKDEWHTPAEYPSAVHGQHCSDKRDMCDGPNYCNSCPQKSECNTSQTSVIGSDEEGQDECSPLPGEREFTYEDYEQAQPNNIVIKTSAHRDYEDYEKAAPAPEKPAALAQQPQNREDALKKLLEEQDEDDEDDDEASSLPGTRQLTYEDYERAQPQNTVMKTNVQRDYQDYEKAAPAPEKPAALAQQPQNREDALKKLLEEQDEDDEDDDEASSLPGTRQLTYEDYERAQPQNTVMKTNVQRDYQEYENAAPATEKPTALAQQPQSREDTLKDLLNDEKENPFKSQATTP